MMQAPYGPLRRCTTSSSCAKMYQSHTVSGFNLLWVIAAAYLQMWLNNLNVIMRLTACHFLIFCYLQKAAGKKKVKWWHQFSSTQSAPLTIFTSDTIRLPWEWPHAAHGEQTLMEGADDKNGFLWSINSSKWSHVTISFFRHVLRVANLWNLSFCQLSTAQEFFCLSQRPRGFVISFQAFHTNSAPRLHFPLIKNRPSNSGSARQISLVITFLH